MAVAGLRGGDRGGGDGPARLDHHAGRGADHPARAGRLVRGHRVGDRRVRPGHGGGAADRRALGRPLRPTADAANRDGRVRRGLGAVRGGGQRGRAHRGPGGAGGPGRDHAAAGVRADQGPVRGARDGQGVRRLRAGDGPVGHARADRGGRADRGRRVRYRLADDLPGKRAGRAGGAGARRAAAPSGRFRGRLGAGSGAGSGAGGWTCRVRCWPRWPCSAWSSRWRRGTRWAGRPGCTPCWPRRCWCWPPSRSTRSAASARAAPRSSSRPSSDTGRTGPGSCSRSCSSARWAGS